MRKLPEINTDRLLLREVTTADAADIAEWISDPSLYRYWASKPLPYEKSPLEYFGNEDKLNKIKNAYDDINVVIYHKNDKKVIGEIEIYDIQGVYQGEISYRISPAYQGQGICTEAVKAFCEAVFLHTKIGRISAHIDVRNTVSEKLIKKIGFSYEGTSRQHLFFDTISDWRLYSFLREDYNIKEAIYV
jgi:ribosomal-protein-alanine N-acetyltransferase